MPGRKIHITHRPRVDRERSNGTNSINHEESALVFCRVHSNVNTLLLFSYTQVDLNLTLFPCKCRTDNTKGFQFVGFYQRPVATLLYAAILLSCLCSMACFLRM